jgi:thiol-disulfide isomerase/thioredoxin
VWVQGPPVSLAFARGAVALVDFWESTCVNCLRTLPYLKAWHARYAARGLVMVGVHTPEFELSASPEVVGAAVAAEGIPYPVLLDSSRETWQLFANHYWPAKYLIDARGYLRYEHFGEGAYGETEGFIQRLLREAGDAAPMPPPLAPLRAEDRPGAVCQAPSPEAYAGYHRGRLLAAEGYRPEEDVLHRGEAEVPPGMFAARGLWHHAAEYLEAREPGAELTLVAEAAGINAVLAPAGEAAVGVDGAPVAKSHRGADLEERGGATWAVWERPRLVALVDSAVFVRRTLTLRFPVAGARVYSFSFTGCERAV